MTAIIKTASEPFLHADPQSTSHRADQPGLQEIKFSAAVHLVFDQRELGDLPFGLSVRSLGDDRGANMGARAATRAASGEEAVAPGFSITKIKDDPIW